MSVYGNHLQLEHPEHPSWNRSCKDDYQPTVFKIDPGDVGPSQTPAISRKAREKSPLEEETHCRAVDSKDGFVQLGDRMMSWAIFKELGKDVGACICNNRLPSRWQAKINFQSNPMSNQFPNRQRRAKTILFN